MSKKFIGLVFGAGVLLAVILLFLGTAPEAGKIKTSGLPMKVSRYFWPGQYWQEIAHKKGWFQDAGLMVELVDTNSDYEASLRDMVAGKMDSNNFTLFSLMQFQIEGSDLVLVLLSDDSFGAEALVAGAKIKSIRDLKGKTIGVDRGSYLEYILAVVLDRNGLSCEDIRVVDLTAEKAAEAFVQKKVNAILTWEPMVTEAMEKGKGHKLFDTSAIPGISPAGCAFHRDFIEKRPEDVEAFVGVWRRTADFIRGNPKEAFGIIAEIYKESLGEVEAFAQVDRIMDLHDNQTAFTYAAGFESLHGSARRINRYMIDHGLTPQQMDSTEFIDGRFIRNLR